MSRKKKQHADPSPIAEIELPHVPEAQARWTALGSSALALALYILTLYPSVPGGDSGELIAVAHTLGTAHPPGYPLFTMIGKIFSWIPHGSPAWRINLLSAVSDAGAVFFLCLSTIRLTRSLAAGILAGGLFAFSPLVWSYAVAAEVFALNNFFVALLTYIAVRFSEEHDLRWARWGAFCLGLGLTNHHTLIFFGAPLVVWIFWTKKAELLNVPAFSKLAGLFALGLLPYAYLPLAALRNPVIAWGDFSTWDGFINHVLRRDYGTFQLAAGAQTSQLWKGLTVYAKDLPKEMFFIGHFVAAAGAFFALKRKPRNPLVWTLTAAFFIYIVIFHHLANLPIENPLYLGVHIRFWQMPNMILFLFVGLGFNELLRRYWPNARQISLIAVACLAVSAQIFLHYKTQDQHKNTMFHDFGMSILRDLPEKAVIFSRGDIYTNTTRYLQQCEGIRPDVTVLDRELLSYPWMKQQVTAHYPQIKLPGAHYRYQKGDPNSFTLGDLLIENGKHFPVFICNMDPHEDHAWKQPWSWPFGVVNRIYTQEASFDFDEYLRISEKAFLDLPLVPTSPLALISWEYYIWSEYWEADHRRARRILTYGFNEKKNPQYIRESIRIMERLLKMHPSPPLTLYKNLGFAYNALISYDPSAKEQMIARWTQYLQLGAQDPDAPAIIKTIEDAQRAPRKKSKR